MLRRGGVRALSEGNTNAQPSRAFNTSSFAFSSWIREETSPAMLALNRLGESDESGLPGTRRGTRGPGARDRSFDPEMASRARGGRYD